MRLPREMANWRGGQPWLRALGSQRRGAVASPRAGNPREETNDPARSPRLPTEGRMQLDLQCQKCEESFSLEVTDVQADPTLRCPGCGTRAPTEQVEALVSGFEELFASIAPLRRKFSVAIEVDSEDLPPPYDEAPAVARKAPLLDEEDSEDEEDEDDELSERELE